MPPYLLTDYWTIYLRDRQHPILRIEVTAEAKDQKPAVECVARKLFGRHGRAEHGYHGPESLRTFVIAAEGPDGTISGARAIQRWAKWKYGRSDGTPIEPQAVLAFQAWEDQNSSDGAKREAYGLDAEFQHRNHMGEAEARLRWRKGIRKGWGD